MKTIHLLAIPLLVLSLTQCNTTKSEIKEVEQEWQNLPEKVDILAFMAHPDDENFWGGALTYYSKCLNKKVLLVCLTSGEYGNGLPHPVEEGEAPDCSYDDSDYPCWPKISEEDLVYPCYYRETELQNAAKVYGLKYKPIHPHFKDMASIQPWGEVEGGYAFWGGKDRVVDTMVYYIRKLKPEVVLSLSWHGGNGNPQHIAVGRGAVAAAEVAGNPDAYTWQLQSLKTWQPKKVYLHLEEKYIDSSENYMTHHWDIPCGPNDSLTVKEISAMGLGCHESQMKGFCHEKTNFELRYTSVGKDSDEAKDFFEHIE